MRRLLYVNNLYSTGQMVEQALKSYIAITDKTGKKMTTMFSKQIDLEVYSGITSNPVFD